MGKQSKPYSKLFNLREWLTVPETTKYLSLVFEEEVTELDVLRLSLDGHLTLSVNFVNGTHGILGKIVNLDDAQLIEVRDISARIDPGSKERAKGKKKDIVKGIKIEGSDKVIELEKDVEVIWGVWDLPMIGAERLDIEHKYQMATGGPEVTAHNLANVFVRNQGGHLCQLQEHLDENEFCSGSNAQLKNLKNHIAIENIKGEEAEILLNGYKKEREKFLAERAKQNRSEAYYPAANLPNDSVLVVRTSALTELKNRIASEETTTKKPLGRRAETTYLNIIGAMLEYLAGNSPGKQKHPDFVSEAKLIEHFSGFNISGLSKTTLELKFASAKSFFKSAM